MSSPVFSLLHTTRRVPFGWVDAARAWLRSADRPHEVEYVLCVDECDEGRLSEFALDTELARAGSARLVVNHGPRSAVAGWNTAAAASSGHFLITVADDWAAPAHWDTWILNALPRDAEGRPDLGGKHVLWVATGGDPHIMTFSLLTRAYFAHLGGVIFNPGFVGMFADNDYTAQAEFDGVIVDCRKTLPVFPHSHPEYGTAEWDDTYRWQHRPEAFEVGGRLFRERQRARRELKRQQTGAPRQRTVAVCLPGETFCQTWVAAWTRLFTGLLVDGWSVSPLWAVCSNVYAVRQQLVELVNHNEEYTDIDYVLWLDDDNILSIDEFRLLFSDLESRPDVASAAAWTWIDRNPAVVSAGRLSDSAECQPFSADFMYEAQAAGLPLVSSDIVTADSNPFKFLYHGFACVLMRRELLDLVGPRPFVPVLSPRFASGMSGEDSAFCLRAQQSGARLLIDPRVMIPHLKTRIVVGPQPSRPVKSSPDSSGVDKERSQCVEV